MANPLTGQTIQSTYEGLIKTGDNTPLTSSEKVVSDGLGNESGLTLSTAGIGVTKRIKDETAAIGALGQVLTPTATGVIWKDLETTGKYRQLGGVIRNTAGTWAFINDAGHVPLNLTSISQGSTSIRVNYNKTYTKVVTFSVTPDETYAEIGISAGASVGLGFADIYLYQNRTINAYIYYDGSSWQSSGDALTSISYSSGVLSFNHPQLYASSQNAISATPQNGSAYNYYAGTQSGTSSEIYIYNPDGTAYTGAVNTNMKFFFSKTASGILTNAQSAISLSNIWISGIMLDTL